MTSEMHDSKKMIIGKTYIESVDDKASRLCACITTEDSKEYVAWYEVSKEFEQYLCTERADAFVVNTLLYAMEHSYDIICEDPMSERLFYQLTEYLIPAISKNLPRYHAINIKAQLTSERLQTADGAGGSLSGGVDSFYTILRHCNRKEEDFNITHLTFFNAGASGAYGGDEARRRYLSRIDFVKDVADKLNVPLVCVDTNINEFLQQDHEPTHTMRTLSIILALQKLFSKYYFASGFPFSSFEFTDFDTAPYDLLNVQMLSTENTTFYLSGGETTRLEKLDYISQFDITYPRLNVCVCEDTNCNVCLKCQRTIMELYVLGKLDLYDKVFDVQYFQDHKKDFMINAYMHRDEYDWRDVYPILKKKNDINTKIVLIGRKRLLAAKVKKLLGAK